MLGLDRYTLHGFAQLTVAALASIVLGLGCGDFDRGHAVMVSRTTLVCGATDVECCKYLS